MHEIIKPESTSKSNFVRCPMLSIIVALDLESLSLIYANMNVITDRLQQYYAFLKGYLTLHCNNDYDIANLTFWILNIT